MADYFANVSDAVASPARRLLVVTPSNTTDLTDTPKAIFVGTGGDLALIAADDGAAVTLRNIGSGSIVPVRARRVVATGTTASDIVAMY